MRIAYHVLSAPAPLGLLFVAATARGVRHLEYLDRRSLKRAIAAHAAANPGSDWEPSVRELRPLGDLVEQYFCGAVKHFDVPLDLQGSEFQLKVWRAIAEIPYGETRTYGEIAKAIGEPRSARAVGLAANQNPVMILVPCHRVVGSDGKLTGYAGGLPRKKALLELEARFRSMRALEGDHVIEAMVVQVPRAEAAPARALAAKPKPAPKAARAARIGVARTPAAKPKAAAAGAQAAAPASRAPARRAAPASRRSR